MLQLFTGIADHCLSTMDIVSLSSDKNISVAYTKFRETKDKSGVSSFSPSLEVA